MANEYAAVISREMNLGPRQASAIVRMLGEDLPIPFIARYRKEQTGGMDEATLAVVRQRLLSLAALDEAKKSAAVEMETLGKLNDKLAEQIAAAEDMADLNDVCLANRCQAAESRKGVIAALPMAARLIDLQPADMPLEACLAELRDTDAVARPSNEDAKAVGTIDFPDAPRLNTDDRHIVANLVLALASLMSTAPKARRLVRQRYQRSAEIRATIADPALAGEPAAAPFSQFFDFSEPLRLCTPQRFLTLCRGRDNGILVLSIDISGSDTDANTELVSRLKRMFIRSTLAPDMQLILSRAVEVAFDRSLRPLITEEISSNARRRFTDAAIEQMADNLRERLLASPMLPQRRVMGVYPETSDIVHVACIDPTQRFADPAVGAVATLRPISDPYGSAEHLGFLLERNIIETAAVADMPAARAFENLLSTLQLPHSVEVHYVSARLADLVADAELALNPAIANSPDAVYSRPVAAGRLLLDPLVQLLKVDPLLVIDPVLHPDSVDPTLLREKIDDTIESCVCAVGLDPNGASAEMLRIIPGIGTKLAGYIVDYRAANGPFSSREDLRNVPRMGDKAYNLCAPFLRIPRSTEPLDATAIHPERYDDVRRMAEDMNVTPDRLIRSNQLLGILEQNAPGYANRHLSASTIKFIIDALRQGGDDPRLSMAHHGAPMSPVAQAAEAQSRQPRQQGAPTAGGSTPAIDPEFLATLHIGQVIEGRVSHMVSYGAFVNIGHNTSGLLHVSQMSDDFVGSPNEVLTPGQTVRVRIMDVDPRHLRIALTLRGVPQD